ncbi:cytochrome P450 307a1-like, partial [Drosophila eugracilis]|uniref:cytochrome P450 307a1-like n=1 Tax=Drosophila eugracilis TaxID=29029 RepID=UPI001BD95986
MPLGPDRLNYLNDVIEYLDEIFRDINQGYLFDFLPWLIPFYTTHIKKIMHWSTTKRKFILYKIVDCRESNINLEEPDKDFTDALLKSLREDQNVSRNTIIFMFEDFIGGHTAVGNLIMLVLAYIAKNPIIGELIMQEVDFVSNYGVRSISLYDMNKMPYIMAVILEVLRHSSSPIVPHVAMEDTGIPGFGVTKETIVFINNFVLNISENNWKYPAQFEPKRFLDQTPVLNKLGKITKKNYNNGFQLKKCIPLFLPFSVGKRTCLGKNLIRGFGFHLLVYIIKNYNVNSADFSKI